MLKILSYILAIIVLFLSIEPLCMDDNCCEKTVTTETSSADEKQGDCCSPFIKCKTCSGPVISNFVFSFDVALKIPKEVLILKKKFLTQSNPLSIWNPPKVV